MHHDANVILSFDEANALDRRVARSFERLQVDLPVLLTNADASLEAVFQTVLETVNAGTDAAIASIETNYQTARRQVIGAAPASARGSIPPGMQDSKTRLPIRIHFEILASLISSGVNFRLEVACNSSLNGKSSGSLISQTNPNL